MCALLVLFQFGKASLQVIFRMLQKEIFEYHNDFGLDLLSCMILRIHVHLPHGIGNSHHDTLAKGANRVVIPQNLACRI
jgi:cytochrome b561